MTEQSFLNKLDVFGLIKEYGSPLYVYDENTLRKRCREIRNLLPINNFRVNFSAKANSNKTLLEIIRDEDIDVDAMSPGEIYIQLKAGFPPKRIFYIGNNVSKEEMQFAIDNKVLVSVDSLSQLELFGMINPQGEVAVRFNPGIGVGHHDKVVTGGKNTKFGVQKEFVPQVKELLNRYDLELVGINQHIGSLFLEEHSYIDAANKLFEIAKNFEGLEFIDIGGGFGVPYRKSENRLDLGEVSKKLLASFNSFTNGYGNKNVVLKVEPGRYLVAECGILLGEIYSVKENYAVKYVGTDLGFNVLARPVMYAAYHEASITQRKKLDKKEIVTIVGNICESGDIIAKDRLLPVAKEGDIVAVMNTGAYGYAMSSNYNLRLKPAEILVKSNGDIILIRKRDTFNSLLDSYQNI